jgi:hypothetical protein
MHRPRPALEVSAHDAFNDAPCSQWHAIDLVSAPGSMFNDVSLAIKHVRQNERGKVTKVLIVDLTSTQGRLLISTIRTCAESLQLTQELRVMASQVMGSLLTLPRMRMCTS